MKRKPSSDEPASYDPSKSELAAMMRIIFAVVHNNFPEAFMVRGALHPTIQIDIPRRNGDVTSYSISIS